MTKIGKFGTSQSVPRKEDLRFLTGQGRYMQDTLPDGVLHAVFVRSPTAHAEVTGLDVAAAREMPGVLGAWTAADFAALLEEAGLPKQRMWQDEEGGFALFLAEPA